MNMPLAITTRRYTGPSKVYVQLISGNLPFIS
jgi:hypothetical protein